MQKTFAELWTLVFQRGCCPCPFIFFIHFVLPASISNQLSRYTFFWYWNILNSTPTCTSALSVLSQALIISCLYYSSSILVHPFLALVLSPCSHNDGFKEHKYDQAIPLLRKLQCIPIIWRVNSKSLVKPLLISASNPDLPSFHLTPQK